MTSFRSIGTTTVATVALLGAGAATIAAPAGAYGGDEKIRNVHLTLYGGQGGDNITGDNSNPRGIAWPREDGYPTIHNLAGGDGSWQHPITLAVAKHGPFKPGTRFFIPAVHRYFIAEDTCEQCGKDWNNGHQQHVDMWAGKNATPAAMNDFPASGYNHTIIVNPTPDHKVDTTGPLLTHERRTAIECSRHTRAERALDGAPGSRPNAEAALPAVMAHHAEEAAGTAARTGDSVT